MQALVISGSRNRQGKTAQAAEAIRRGVTRGGGKSESIFLTELKLERCRQCNPDGWGICRSEGRCVIEDDFAGVVEKIKAADVVVFANPVYFGDLCESLRGFLDRYRRIRFSTAFRPPAPGAPPMGFGAGGIPAIGIAYAGGSGNGTISCLANLERVLQTCGFDVVDMIPARRQNLDVKLLLLEKIGEWLASKPTSGPWPPPAPPSR
jgi:NAD(P)H-dependent FMN reductase